MDTGRAFLHEHPMGASSWALPAMQSLLQDSRVIEVKANMCRFGMVNVDNRGNISHVRTPTRFATNSWGIADELGKKSDGRHAHCQLVAGRAKAAEVYPYKLCESICRGFTKELDMGAARLATTRKMHKKEMNGLAKKAGIRHQTSAPPEGIKQHWVDEVHEEEGTPIHPGDTGGIDFKKELEKSVSMLINSGGTMTAWDDVSHARLDLQGVQEATRDAVLQKHGRVHTMF